jgi:hypothetical protein
MVIGGLNCYNSVGEYYVAKDSRKLFEKSSHLMRRLKTGQLRAEMDHPKRTPGMSTSEWVNRVMSIDSTRVCAHFSEIWLDEDFGKNNPQHGNPDMVAIMAKVCPSGPYAESLRASLNNPKENVAFSIRSITDQVTRNGRVEKTVTQIMTWDYVPEPGIAIATKWNTPTLEDLQLESISEELFVRVAKEMELSPVSTESSRELFKETLAVFEERKKLIVPKQNRLMSW